MSHKMFWGKTTEFCSFKILVDFYLSSWQGHLHVHNWPSPIRERTQLQKGITQRQTFDFDLIVNSNFPRHKKNINLMLFSPFLFFFFPERKKEKELWIYCSSPVEIKWILYLDNLLFSTFGGNTPNWVWDMPDLNDSGFTVQAYLHFIFLNTLD